MPLSNYSKIEQSSLDDSSFSETAPSEPEFESKNCSCNSYGTKHTVRLWKLSTFIFSFLLCLSLASNLLISHHASRSPHTPSLSNPNVSPFSSYLTGFTTDLQAVREEIELIEYEFTGEVELDDTTGEFLTGKQSNYVGKPSVDIDRAWQKLLTGSFLLQIPINKYNIPWVFFCCFLEKE